MHCRPSRSGRDLQSRQRRRSRHRGRSARGLRGCSSQGPRRGHHQRGRADHIQTRASPNIRLPLLSETVSRRIEISRKFFNRSRQRHFFVCQGSDAKRTRPAIPSEQFGQRGSTLPVHPVLLSQIEEEYRAVELQHDGQVVVAGIVHNPLGELAEGFESQLLFSANSALISPGSLVRTARSPG